ncbi:MAG: hypothetical protein SVU32_08930, partial [Candidatus Nanohaloarchaea archaeon]|nr:hypothetical protein [Candidatus Nanohaloarchaea archaeon]
QLLLELDWTTYRNTTGLELDDPPDTVTVDRRGHSPDVAEELGNEYMEGQVVLFDDEQQYADYADSFIRQNRPIDDLLDVLYRQQEDFPILGELELSTRDSLRLACRQIPFLEQVDGQELHEDIASLSQDDIQHSTSLSTLKDKASDEELPLKAYGKEIAAVQVESYGWEHEDGEGVVFDTDPVVSIGTSSDVPYEDVHAVEIGKERYDDLSPTPGDHFLDLEPQEWLGPMSYNLFRKEDEDADEVFRVKLDDETTLTAKR